MKRMTLILLGACLVGVGAAAPSRPPRSGANAEMIASDGGGFVGPTMQFMMWPDGLWWHRKGIGPRAATATGKMTPAQRGAFLPTDAEDAFRKELAAGKKLLPVRPTVAEDKSPTVESLRAAPVWLIKGTEVWKSPVPKMRSRGPMFNATVRNGPAWPTGIKIDVVVRLRAKDGKTYLLRAANQLIHRVS
jgi:hypothetical protein